MIYSWICCQLGAREHYAIPRALHLNQQLKLLITDFWLPDSSPLNLLPKPWLSNLRQRHHPELDTAQVKSFNYQTVNYEFIARQKQLQGWDRIIDRNYWWQQQVIKQLDRTKLPDKQITLFAYSYAALEIFKYAQQRGWKLILGQIDPGIIEEKLVHKIAQKYLKLQPKPDLLPLQYWSNWREECRLADRIVVNSDWSRQALAKTGIEPDKITTIPLAYKATASKFKRTYPPRFTPKRPLKVLFLGQIIIRKGIGEILEAITLLNKSINPALVEFWFVGEIKIKLSPKIKHYPQIKWLGSVSRNDTHNYYQQADILLLPTHSDGFGLTQLEAQAWKLPIIASQFCGSVVKQQINGLILPQITAREIVKSITFCLNNPQKLTDFSKNSTQTLSKFSLNKLAQKITTININ